MSECGFCKVPIATGRCTHIIHSGSSRDGQVTMSLYAWNRQVQELSDLRTRAAAEADLRDGDVSHVHGPDGFCTRCGDATDAHDTKGVCRRPGCVVCGPEVRHADTHESDLFDHPQADASLPRCEFIDNSDGMDDPGDPGNRCQLVAGHNGDHFRKFPLPKVLPLTTRPVTRYEPVGSAPTRSEDGS